MEDKNNFNNTNTPENHQYYQNNPEHLQENKNINTSDNQYYNNNWQYYNNDNNMWQYENQYGNESQYYNTNYKIDKIDLQRYSKAFILGFVLLIFIIIGCFFFLYQINIQQQEINTGNNVVAAENPANISGNLYQIILTDKYKTTERKFDAYVPYSQEYIEKTKSIELKEYTDFTTITDGIQVHVTTLFRFDRLTAEEFSKDILNIYIDYMNSNNHFKNINISEFKVKNNVGYYIIDFEEKGEDNNYYPSQTYIMIAPTEASNIYLKYEFTLHGSIKNERSDIIFNEIKSNFYL